MKHSLYLHTNKDKYYLPSTFSKSRPNDLLYILLSDCTVKPIDSCGSTEAPSTRFSTILGDELRTTTVSFHLLHQASCCNLSSAVGCNLPKRLRICIRPTSPGLSFASIFCTEEKWSLFQYFFSNICKSSASAANASSEPPFSSRNVTISRNDGTISTNYELNSFANAST